MSINEKLTSIKSDMHNLNCIIDLLEISIAPKQKSLENNIKSTSTNKIWKLVTICVILILLLLGVLNHINLWIALIGIVLVIGLFIFQMKKELTLSEEVNSIETNPFLHKMSFLEHYNNYIGQIQDLWNNRIIEISEELEKKYINEDLSYSEKLELEAITSKKVYLSFEQGSIVNKYFELGDSVGEYNEFVESVYKQVEDKINETIELQLEYYCKLIK